MNDKLHAVRKKMKLSEPVISDPIQRAIDRANSQHYTDALPPMPKKPEHVARKTKVNIRDSKHRASKNAMDKLKGMLKDGK